MPYNLKYYTDNYTTFDEWFELVLNNDEVVYPSLRIPYSKWLEEYIKEIENRSIDEVKKLLRCLLCPITRGFDISDYETYLLLKESKIAEHTEMAKKMSHNERYHRLANGQDAWEGMTWVLELLPSNPYNAIKALESYVYAQPNLPDDRIIGIDQCIQIILARFITLDNSFEILLNLKPIEFEWLIEHLYESMGYETIWTTSTRDGGKDIIATIQRTDGIEHVYIECKLYKTTSMKIETIRAFRDTGLLISSIDRCSHFKQRRSTFILRGVLDSWLSEYLLVLQLKTKS
ncbi:restriction endonuclease [Paenibacillus sp. 3LSP]|uniref:restriction endonuclease n=1 Tax=Paenibacillus sp. 3LSP TaxID=2800795 RepID=UPI0028FD5E07|nr:restriction endonuclease [Paenibacillus sp. 3LSP]MDU0331894.1 restriction endonuclease [Paenibacillus sp. 3LSP]